MLNLASNAGDANVDAAVKRLPIAVAGEIEQLIARENPVVVQQPALRHIQPRSSARDASSGRSSPSKECSLSATISAVDQADAELASRNSMAVQATLAPGRASRIDAGAGELLQFFCRSGAQTMIATKANETLAPRSVGPLAASPGRRLDLLAATGL